MKTVYFVRHGETEANAKQVLAGARTNTPLTKKGVQQAHDAAWQLRSKPIDAIIASPLARAYETACIVAKDVGFEGEVIVSALFIERDFGGATGLSYQQARELLDSQKLEDVESVDAFAARAERALDWLQKLEATNILVVSHGGFGQMFGTIVEVKQPADFLSYPHLGNAEYYEFKLGGGA